uniref:Uncharacterized protein n=1 Tax=Chromera velia CCMP2878 TaxID=1169474 RepID=A0A0G4HEI9_9ALVE|eukprot:Cvel_26648.t1-p1 / transcript=Cvel_26648.t1 / gene=Cvel_26648 / organism=Chromera_velia_CCMP2878 / gene_product=hypothetical protein / transcript_product=hypothetical protein / location=Cvel_scaffold3205:15077-15409(-) / protein_length=111 / sequence_SO=supercontig / SO=protein_coding / is_pseudo=false
MSAVMKLELDGGCLRCSALHSLTSFLTLPTALACPFLSSSHHCALLIWPCSTWGGSVRHAFAASAAASIHLLSFSLSLPTGPHAHTVVGWLGGESPAVIASYALPAVGRAG